MAAQGLAKAGKDRAGSVVAGYSVSIEDAAKFDASQTRGLKTSPLIPASSLKGLVRELLTHYAGAVSRANHIGRPVEMTIQVLPSKTRVETTTQLDALDHALAAARARGASSVADILRSPDMVNARAFGELIGASHETVNQKRKAGAILGLEGATRGLRYPKWQIGHDGRLLPGLAELFRILGGEPWTVYRFLVQEHGELGGDTALASLKHERVKQALSAARNMTLGVFA